MFCLSCSRNVYLCSPASTSTTTITNTANTTTFLAETLPPSSSSSSSSLIQLNSEFNQERCSPADPVLFLLAGSQRPESRPRSNGRLVGSAGPLLLFLFSLPKSKSHPSCLGLSWQGRGVFFSVLLDGGKEGKCTGASRLNRSPTHVLGCL